MGNLIFDYIYYRVIQFYFKWDGRNGATALIIVSMIQALLVIDLLLIILKLKYTKEQIAPNSKYYAYVGVGIFLVFLVSNYWRYRNKYNYLKKIWKDESPKSRKLRGVLVIVSLITPWILFLLMGSF
ncbi:hypothetical protein KJS94_09650 [Flavihumibacter rivuli]|uniref:hypothetical protein n=1 Tax=Flavihumibacter rivuli TaxID=2838156 RepID=UPI001BDE164E|nr:hypothetical protein [Flavihumibacter rivuli]ULQ54901.1 hypothetical protein KJS94_09650 [Flavihumibacter rivuli]